MLRRGMWRALLLAGCVLLVSTKLAPVSTKQSLYQFLSPVEVPKEKQREPVDQDVQCPEDAPASKLPSKRELKSLLEKSAAEDHKFPEHIR